MACRYRDRTDSPERGRSCNRGETLPAGDRRLYGTRESPTLPTRGVVRQLRPPRCPGVWKEIARAANSRSAAVNGRVLTLDARSSVRSFRFSVSGVMRFSHLFAQHVRCRAGFTPWTAMVSRVSDKSRTSNARGNIGIAQTPYPEAGDAAPPGKGPSLLGLSTGRGVGCGSP